MIRYRNLTQEYGWATRSLKVPFSGTFELTPRCNMNCKMCYIRMTEDEMKHVGTELSVDEWIRIAEEAVKEGMVMLLLTGGEALLYKGFKELYLRLRKLGIFISINTNGTMLNDEWIDFFKKNPPSKFNVTIYGGSNETYERLCGNPKGFDQLKSAIEKLQKNKLDIMLNCTITKQNVDDMENIFAFGKQHDLQMHVTTYNFPPVRKEGILDPELNRLSPTEAAKARIRLNWNAVSDSKRFIKNIDESLHKLDENTNICIDEFNEGDKVLCAAGRSNFWITWDGRMLPCGMIPDFSISIKNHNFNEVWKDIVAYTETIRLAPECKKCSKKELCKPCAAKLYAESGQYNLPAQYICEYTDEYIRLLRAAKLFLEKDNE